LHQPVLLSPLKIVFEKARLNQNYGKVIGLDGKSG